MARISSYDQDSSLNSADKLLGTDSATGATKNFTIQSVLGLVNDGGLVQAFDGSTFQFTDYVAPGSSPQGILNLNEGTATTAAFSAINQIFISVKDASGLSLAEYLDNTANDFIKISKKDNLNNFGIFEVTAIQSSGSGEYRRLTVTPRGTNGNLTVGEKYFVANYSALYDQDFSDDAITEFGDVANTFFTGSTASQLTAAGSGSIITTAERTSLTNFTNNGLIHGDVVNNLVTNTTDVPLSANQGLVLKGLIDGINTLLASDDTTLDTIQEVVDFIKTNKSTLDSLGVSSIPGLQAALDAKENSVTGKSLSSEDFTNALLLKLNGIAAGAEVNVAHDYNTLSNKPTDVTVLSGHSVTDLGDVATAGSGDIITSAERIKLTNIETSADVTDTTNVVAALSAGSNITISGLGEIAANDTTYDLTVHDSGDNAIIRLSGSNSTTDDVTLVAGTNVTLTPSSSNLTIGLSTAAVANGSASLVTGDHVFDYADPKFARKDQAEVFTNDVTVQGNLLVSGTTTTVNSTNLNIGDAIITLNSDLGGGVSPTENAGIEINRGSGTDVAFRWNETSDKWEFTNDGSTFYQLATSIGDLASAKLELDQDLVINSKIVTKHSNSVKSMTTTVVTKTAAHPAHGVGSTSGYSIDGIESPELTFAAGNTYKFDQSDSSNLGHPLKFYKDEARNNPYTAGVTTNGTPGQSGSYTQIIPTELTPNALYYQCQYHSNMGWKAVFNTSTSSGNKYHTVTVGSKTGGGNAFYVDGGEAPVLVISANDTYRFDVSDSTNTGHAFQFSENIEGAGTGAYTANTNAVGTPGQAGAYIDITGDYEYSSLYYYCPNHTGMGNRAKTDSSSYLGGLTSDKIEFDHDLILDSKILTKHSDAAKTMAVTVVTKTAAHPANGSGSSSGYAIDGIESPEITFAVGNTYKFDQSDSTNANHPLLFYYDEAKTTAYTAGVTNNHGSTAPGNSGSYTQIIPTESTPTTLYYQCSAHSNMGWKTVFNTRNLTGFDTDNLSEGSSNLYHTTTRVNSAIDSRVTNTFINNLSGVVADTTTALATARNIGGVSFDGTADINLPGVNASGTQDTSGNAGTATTLATSRNIHGVAFNGSADIDLSEVIQDTVGAMFSSNTETNITATYQDLDGTIDLVVSASGIADVAADSSPQLGGNLDVNGNSIVSASNGNISITPNGSGKVILDGLSHPQADGNAGQVLKTDGSGNLAFASVSSLAGAGIQNVSDDSSPQLGGALDVVTHGIVSASNRDINITPNGTGKVVVGTNGIEFGDGSVQTVAVSAVTKTVAEISSVANATTNSIALGATPTNKNFVDLFVSGVYQSKSNYGVSGSTLTLSAGNFPEGAHVETITTTN